MDVQLITSLGIDLGTSSVKIGLFDKNLKLKTAEIVEYGTKYPGEGGAEQNPADWWDAIIRGCQRIRESNPVDWKEIRSVGVSGQFSGTVPVDEQGNVLHDAIIWLDSRGEEETRKLISGFPSLEGYRIDKLFRWIRLTGGAPTRSGKDSISHILYLRHVERDVFSRTFKFLEPKDYINLKLTGKMFGTYDSMVLHWITDNRDPQEIAYSDRLLTTLGMNRALFPDLKGSWEPIGKLSRRARDELLLNEDAIVAGGAGDIQSAIVGSGCFDNFEPILYIGSSSWISCHVPFKKTDLIHNIASLPSALPGKYFVAAEQENAGSAFSYMKEILFGEDNKSSFSDMDRLAMNAPPGSDGLIFLPWLYGERAPVESKYLRSSFFNMSLNHNRSHFVRSVMEGVAYNTRWLFSIVEKFVGRKLPYLIMSGGGAKSDLWAELMADILKREIRVLDEPIHVNSRGAAILSQMAMIKEHSFPPWQKDKEMKVFRPDPRTEEVHSRNFEAFMRFYRDNKKSMHLLHP